jgi:hypothetical protein
MSDELSKLNIEDLKTYFYDAFLSTETQEYEFEGTGYKNASATNVEIHTGRNSPSSCLMHYDRQAFNPRYGEIVFKVRINSQENVLAFFGYLSDLTIISEDMITSHVGIIIKNGHVFFSSADGSYQEKVEIMGLDLTKVYEIKISELAISIKPLPQVISYLGLPEVEYAPREWRKIGELTTYIPVDEMHYIAAYVENSTNADKYLTFNRIIYKERYAD